MRPRRFADSLMCAVRGIASALGTEKHLRFHCAAAVSVLMISALLQIDLLRFALLVVLIAFVISAELMNTAIEKLVDAFCPAEHPIAGRVKDIAAGGVLVAVTGAVAAGAVILIPEITKYLR